MHTHCHTLCKRLWKWTIFSTNCVAKATLSIINWSIATLTKKPHLNYNSTESRQGKQISQLAGKECAPKHLLCALRIIYTIYTTTNIVLSIGLLVFCFSFRYISKRFNNYKRTLKNDKAMNPNSNLTVKFHKERKRWQK